MVKVLLGVLLATAVLLAVVAATRAPALHMGGTARLDRDANPQRPPNVLIFITDDARDSTLAAMAKTRRWMADGGVTFRQGYVTTPSCCPSRASIFSGRYVHNHGVLTQRAGSRLDQRTTLQRYLKERGYFTAMAGKYLNRWPLTKPPPWFDRWAHANGGYFNRRWDVDGSIRRVPTYTTSFIGDKALEHLAAFGKADDTRPWLLYLATFAPHDPRRPEPKYAHATFPAWQGSRVDHRDVSDKPRYLRQRSVPSDSAVLRLRTEQLRTLLSVDDMVDRVFRALEGQGELDDTLVFFLSDNGYSWGEHRYTGKFVPYTESIKVPFLVRWPRHLHGGTTDDRLVANIDIKPTVLDAAGIPANPGDTIDGRSLLAPGRRAALLTEYWRDPANSRGIRSWASLRTPTYQYVENYDQPGGGTIREYYDLQADPGMERNLLADTDPGNVPLVDQLGAELATARRCAGASCP